MTHTEKNIEQTIAADLNVAMKAGDTKKVSLLRMLRSDLRNAAIEAKDSLHDDQVMKVLMKALKQRKDAVESFQAAGRDEQAQAEREEAAMIEAYLPEGLTEEALRSIVRRVADEVGAREMKDMGKVMGPVMKEVAGRADGSFVKQLVEDHLKHGSL